MRSVNPPRLLFSYARLKVCDTATLNGITLDVFSPKGGVAAVKDAVKAGILDLYLVKHWAIKFATDAAVTVLRVDQVRKHVQFSL